MVVPKGAQSSRPSRRSLGSSPKMFLRGRWTPETGPWSAILNTFIRAVEVERRVKELEEVEERLYELELRAARGVSSQENRTY